MNSLSEQEGAAFAVKFRNLSLNYGKVVGLDNVSLDIPARKVVGLIGPDGVGKSTLLSLITGAHAMQGGDIFPIALVEVLLTDFHIVRTHELEGNLEVLLLLGVIEVRREVRAHIIAEKVIGTVDVAAVLADFANLEWFDGSAVRLRKIATLTDGTIYGIANVGLENICINRKMENLIDIVKTFGIDLTQNAVVDVTGGQSGMILMRTEICCIKIR